VSLLENRSGAGDDGARGLGDVDGGVQERWCQRCLRERASAESVHGQLGVISYSELMSHLRCDFHQKL
jgi:hypothetical protein